MGNAGVPPHPPGKPLRADDAHPPESPSRTSIRRKAKKLYERDPALLSSYLVFLTIAAWAIVAWQFNYVALDSAPLHAAKSKVPRCKSVHSAKQSPTVNSASGAHSTLVIVIGRGGRREQRMSTPLAVKQGRLCPGGILSTSTSDFISSNGELSQGQIASWAQVDKYGTHVRVFVAAAPRVGVISGAGGYSGLVSLNDPRAQGGTVPVRIEVLYPFPGIVLPLAFLAAFGGFAWAWLVQDLQIHHKRHGLGTGNPATGEAVDPRDTDNGGHFLRNLALRVSVLLVAAVPVVDIQVLRNPDWQGTLSQYISIATLAGAAAIAATPTFRALILPPSKTTSR
jgi:hypothetical protein